MSSTNHVPADKAPSWLTDESSSAWAVGRPRSPQHPPVTDWSAVPEPTEPSSPAAGPDGDPADDPADDPAGDRPADGPKAKDRPTTPPQDDERPEDHESASEPAPTPEPVPDRPAEPEHPRPDWDSGDSLLTNVVRERMSPPKQGWRALVYRATGGRWNPGLAPSEARLREQLQRTRTPLPEPHSVVVASIKGGIGKTTATALLGLTLAEHRGDRVIAIDANADAGTLGDRLVGEEVASKTTMRDLLHNIDHIRSSVTGSAHPP